MSAPAPGMDRAYVATHIEEDRAHWWFRGRLAVLLAVLAARLPSRRLQLLELGCGTGNVLGELRRFGDPIGVEIDETLRSTAVARGLDARAGALPDRVPVAPGSADVVLMLDVLEHVEAEASALGATRRLLTPGGLLVLTVPAYRWLWSAHDVVLGHRRRYTRAELRRAVEAAGFVVERVSYFNTLLLPAIGVVRLVRRALRRDGHDLRRPGPMVNRVLEVVFGFERHLLRRLDLPFGSSLLLIARG